MSGDIIKDPLIGTLFDGRFKVLEKLGEGGSGRVYRAYDPLLDRELAIKIIHSSLLLNKEAMSRFKQEAATGTLLSHPGICRVYSHGLSEEGQLYLLMDYLNGKSLRDLLSKKGRLDLKEFFEFFGQIIEALACAHKEDIVHRDLKPENIIMVGDAESQRPVLVDFGIAKLIDETAEQSCTQTGSTLGSTAYMSPEQCQGKDNIDVRSDIYSLACVMLESLSGEPPFRAESPLNEMYKHMNQPLSEIATLKTLPAKLSALLKRCLQKEPAARFQSIEELESEFIICSNMQTLKKPAIFRIHIICLLALTAIAIAAYALESLQKKQHEQRALSSRQRQEKQISKEQSADQIRLPLYERDLHEMLLKHCREKSSLESFEYAASVYKRWLREMAPKASLEDRITVISKLTSSYCKLGKEKEAETSAAILGRQSKITGDRIFACNALAELYLQSGKPKKAIVLIDELLKQDDSKYYKDALSWSLASKAFCLQNLKRDKEAIETLKKAVRINNEAHGGISESFRRARKVLITLLLQNKEELELQKYLFELQNSFPDKETTRSKIIADRQSLLANAYADADHLEEAAAFNKRALKLYRQLKDSESILAVSAVQAQIYHEQNKFKEALAERQKTLPLVKDPRQRLAVLNQISNEANYLKDYRTAENAAKEAFALSKELYECNLSHAKEIPDDNQFMEALRHLLSTLNSESKTDEAYRVVAETEEFLSKESKSSFSLSTFKQIKARRLYEDSRKEEAYKELQIASRLLQADLEQETENPKKSAACYAHLLSLYLEENEFLLRDQRATEALPNCKKMIEALKASNPEPPKRINTYLSLGEIYKQNKKTEEALEYYLLAEKLLTEGLRGHYLGKEIQLLQVAYFKMDSLKDYKSAEHLIRASISGLNQRYGSKIPELCQFHLALAKALNYQNKYAEQKAELEKSLLLCKENKINNYVYQQTLKMLWHISMKSKNYDLAAEYLKSSLDSCPEAELSESYKLLCHTYKRANKPELGIACLQEGLNKLKNLKTASPEEINELENELKNLKTGV